MECFTPEEARTETETLRNSLNHRMLEVLSLAADTADEEESGRVLQYKPYMSSGLNCDGKEMSVKEVMTHCV